jgi:hypothetical protein
MTGSPQKANPAPEKASSQLNKRARWGEIVGILLILGLAVFCAHFLKIQHYGLYEDDFHFGWDGWYLYTPRLWLPYFYEWPQGRPLGWFTLLSLFRLSAFFGKLPAAYLIGYLILLTNSLLAYTLFKRLSTSRLFAIVGAIGFTLFPADTAQFFLTHALKLQLSLTYALIAFHLFLSDKKWLSYLFAGLILLNYETPFPILLALPLFRPRIKRKEILSHILILAVIAIVYFGIRSFFMADDRVSFLREDPWKVISNVAQSIWIGPRLALSSWRWGIRYALHNWQPALIPVIFLAGSAFAILMGMLSQELRNDPDQDLPVNLNLIRTKISGRFHLSRDSMIVLKIGLAALVMLVCAYLFSITRVALARTGKTTSSHLGATLPAALIFASGLWLALRLSKKIRGLWAGIVLSSLLIGGIFAYRWLIMEDYKNAWLYQRWYYTQIVTLCPDLSEENQIIVLPVDAYQETFINTYKMAFSEAVLFKMIQFGNAGPPRIFFLDNPEIKTLLNVDGKTYYQRESSISSDPVKETDLIVLSFEDGFLIRETAPVLLAGNRYAVVPPPAEVTPTFTLTDFGYLVYAPKLSGEPIPESLTSQQQP